ncbi:hypothetical protein FRB90_010167 [Tulasnella sp. 427]|nr:hypothetical protein FRB90_010167 [Tulasnella sp. 427]
MATIAVNGHSASPHKHKKRKERPSDLHSIEEEHHHKKKKSKDKHRHEETKAARLEVHGPHKSKSKGKKRMKDTASPFVVVSASTRLSIPPVFAAKPLAGVEEMLDSMVMKHIPSLKGVVLAHSNIQFLEDTAQILNECPFTICNVGFDALVWSPRVGMRLTGQVILFSPDHIALLVNRTFNVSIPARHIPEDEYEFDYQSNEHDGLVNGVGSANGQPQGGVSETKGDETQQDSVMDDPQIDAMGQWVNRTTHERVGGPNLTVEFTVVGMILANQMISLIGSLQPDPLDPRHSEVAAPPVIPHPIEPAAGSESEEEAEEERLPSPSPAKKKKKDKKLKRDSKSS